MEPYPIDSSNTSSSGTAVLVLGFLTLLYFMYDNLEKKIMACRDQHIVTDSRFHVVEDKLATLNELEESVSTLKEAEEERKSSWEDDVTEPNKYQAILGTGLVNGHVVEIRLISESLHTFKSNRYWLLNNDINLDVIRHVLNTKMISRYFKEKNNKIVSTQQSLLGIDEMMRVECTLPKLWNPPYEGLESLGLIVASIRAEEIHWKRALIDTNEN